MPAAETFARVWPFSASDYAHDTRLRGAALPVLVLMEKWTHAGHCRVRRGALCGQLRHNRRVIDMAITAIERAGYYRRQP